MIELNDETTKELLKYLAENMETESHFLTPKPNTTVEIVGLLDKIAELRGISEEENGVDFNKVANNLKMNKL